MLVKHPWKEGRTSPPPTNHDQGFAYAAMKGQKTTPKKGVDTTFIIEVRKKHVAASARIITPRKTGSSVICFIDSGGHTRLVWRGIRVLKYFFVQKRTASSETAPLTYSSTNRRMTFAVQYLQHVPLRGQIAGYPNAWISDKNMSAWAISIPYS